MVLDRVKELFRKPTLQWYYPYYKDKPERPFFLELPAFLPMSAFIGGLLVAGYLLFNISAQYVYALIISGGFIALLVAMLWLVYTRFLAGDGKIRTQKLVSIVTLVLALGLWFLAGILRFHLYSPFNNFAHVVHHYGHKHEYVARVLSIPSLTRSGNWYRTLIEMMYFTEGGDTIVVEGRVMAYVDTFLLPSTVISFVGRIDSPSVIKGLPEFNMRRWLASNNIYGVVWMRSPKVITTDRTLFSFAQELRYDVMQINARYIDSNNVSLVNALTLGYRDELSEDVRESFREAGIIHILAISGLHVGIIYMFLVLVFGFLGKYRIIPLILLLVAFSFITGLMPSVVRASIMLVLVELARITNRKTIGLNILFTAMLIIAMMFPWQVFSIGFWFSAMAVMGILAVWIPMSRMFHVEPSWLRWTISMLAVTISAQVFLIPIQILLWQHISIAGLLGNLLAIPLVTLILLSTIGLWLVSFWHWLASITGNIVNMLTDWLVLWSDLVSELPLNFYIPLRTLVWIAPIIFLLILLVGFARRDKSVWLGVAVLITGIWTYFAMKMKPLDKPFVWNDNTNLIVACPEVNMIYATEQLSKESRSKIGLYTTLINPEMRRLLTDTTFFCMGNYIAYFHGDRKWFDTTALKNSSLWIMDSISYIPVKNLYSYNPNATIVLGSNIPHRTKRGVLTICRRLEMKCVDIAKENLLILEPVQE